METILANNGRWERKSSLTLLGMMKGIGGFFFLFWAIGDYPQHEVFAFILALIAFMVSAVGFLIANDSLNQKFYGEEFSLDYDSALNKLELHVAGEPPDKINPESVFPILVKIVARGYPCPCVAGGKMCERFSVVAARVWARVFVRGSLEISSGFFDAWSINRALSLVAKYGLGEKVMFAFTPSSDRCTAPYPGYYCWSCSPDCHGEQREHIHF